MAQVGWNAGPQHATIWGLAQSYCKKLDSGTKIEHDRDAISLLTLCWSLSKAYMPSDVIAPIETALADSGMPRIATRNVPEGVLKWPLFAIWLLTSTKGLDTGLLSTTVSMSFQHLNGHLPRDTCCRTMSRRSAQHFMHDVSNYLSAGSILTGAMLAMACHGVLAGHSTR
jgi:hypothetical protein